MSKVKKVLTSPAIARMKHSGGPDSDEKPVGTVRGFRVIIYKSNAKSWAMRYRRPDGRSAKFVFGSFSPARDHKSDPDPVIGGHLTLAAASRLATALRHQILIGKDPAEIHRAEKQSVALSAANTFASAASDFITQHAKKKIRNWRIQARMLGLREDENGGLVLIEKGLAARWRDRPVTKIDDDDIHEVVEAVRNRGVFGLARKNAEASEPRARAMHSALSTLFNWLLAKRRIKSSPMVGLARPAKSKARDRVLSNQEIIALWRAADDEGSSPFGAMVKLLLLTGCRLAEVTQMKFAELSDDGAIWVIPGERTKNHREHKVPLAPLARAIIAGIKRLPDCPYILSTNQRTPISGISQFKRRIDRKMPDVQKAWVLHDIRRTVATHMAEKPLSTPPHVIEAALNHVSGAKAGVAGTYNRAGYLEERTAALEKWADRIVELVSEQQAGAEG